MRPSSKILCDITAAAVHFQDSVLHCGNGDFVNKLSVAVDKFQQGFLARKRGRRQPFAPCNPDESQNFLKVLGVPKA
jgi:hypothetical protein